MRQSLSTAVLALSLVLLACSLAHPVQAAQGRGPLHAGVSLLPLGPSTAQPAPPAPYYDEQIGITFPQDATSLSYNVTAVAQASSDGYGPAYLLNGLTDAGYWYQIGLSYNWPFANGGYVSGFAVNFEVFNASGSSIYPAGGRGGLDRFNGTVDNGDSVLLRLSFSGGQLEMRLKDLSTGATGAEAYAAFGTRFIGLATPGDRNGFFTGLMTEWYHVNPYHGSEGKAVYSQSVSPLPSAAVWADEFNSNSSAAVFSDGTTFVFSNPDLVQPFSSNGATAYANAYTFITGTLNSAAFTLSYSVAGGGTGYSAPVLNYTFNGVKSTAALSTGPTTYFLDKGTIWTVTNLLPAALPDERWETTQGTTGVVSSSYSAALVYTHQVLVKLGYSLASGTQGTLPPPAVECPEFGIRAGLALGSPVWVDAGGSCSYSGSLPGSTLSERWATQTATVQVSSPGAITPAYYHQYRLALGYSVVGGGAVAAPILSGTRFGSAFSSPISDSSPLFLDAGTGWSAPATLPESGPLERWVASQPASGSLNGPLALAIAYQHQFAVAIAANPSQGGTPGGAGGWKDAGALLTLAPAASRGWEFQAWSGSGAGSYSGNASSISVTVASPLVENATFYMGLVIAAGPNGQVSYAYGSTSGSVQGGSSVTVYAPPGTTVTLAPSPSSILYAFSGWSTPLNATGGRAEFTFSSPATIQASFSLDYLFAGVLAGVVALAAAALIFAVRRRLGPRGQR